MCKQVGNEVIGCERERVEGVEVIYRALAVTERGSGGDAGRDITFRLTNGVGDRVVRIGKAGCYGGCDEGSCERED